MRAVLLLAAFLLGSASPANSKTAPSPVPVKPAAAARETITLGGGCFWCTEAVFEQLRGVDKVTAGYSGGNVANPSYELVSSGATGHAEVSEVVFDPKVISLKDLLEVFFTLHDPTTLNSQGYDVGTQYRSVIFYRDARQKAIADQVIRSIAARRLYPGKIVTEVAPFKTFYAAEDYHQKYFDRNGEQPYCQNIIAPKVAKLRAHFLDRLKKS